MSQIGNIFIGILGVGFICLFVYWSLEKIVKEKLLSIDKSFLELKNSSLFFELKLNALEKDIKERIESIDRHILAQSKNTIILIQQELEKFRNVKN